MNLAERRAQVREALREQEDVQLLIEGLSLADRFGLYLVESPSEGVTDVLLAFIVEGLAEHGLDTRVERLSGRWGAPFEELVVEVLEPLRTGSQGEPEPLWVLDASGSALAQEEAWARTLRRMNEVRNAIIRGLNQPLVMILPPHLFRSLPGDAPDLWSVRTLQLGLQLDLRPLPLLLPGLSHELLQASTGSS